MNLKDKQPEDGQIIWIRENKDTQWRIGRWDIITEKLDNDPGIIDIYPLGSDLFKSIYTDNIPDWEWEPCNPPKDNQKNSQIRLGKVYLDFGYVVNLDDEIMVTLAEDAIYEDAMNAVKDNELQNWIKVDKKDELLKEEDIPDFLKHYFS